MELDGHWADIKKIFDEAYKSCMYFSIATVKKDGSPHITPIGSLILHDNITGYYLEEFPSVLHDNLKLNPRVCVMAINSDKLFWGKSLLEGRFQDWPGVRLMGTAGELREATSDEINGWLNKVAFARPLKGYKILWENMHHARDITFDRFEPVLLGEMTDGIV